MIPRDAVRNVYGTDVYSTDGDKIGSAGQVYLDNDTGNPAWVAVRTGLFGKKESFVPLQDATLSGERLEVPFGKDQVKHAPRIDQDGELSPADEDALYRYYESRQDRDLRTDPPAASAAASRRDSDDANSQGPSGRTTDDAMTRSEERLVAGTRTEQVGKARLRKYRVTEERLVSVPVTREEVRLEQETTPGTAAGRTTDDDSAVPGGENPEMTLWEERPVVTTERVPVEKVRLRKETVTGQETVSGQVRKEQIELEDDSGQAPRRPSDH